MGHKLKATAWIGMGVVAGVLTTLGATAIARNAMAPLPIDQMRLMAEVFSITKQAYVDPVDEKKMLDGAIGGMVESLDPHSSYLSGKALKDFREGVSGKFVGIGIQIEMQDGLVRIVSPIEGSPGEKAGLRTGDMITRIDETNVRGLALDEAVKKMRGEPDTKVNLMIFRKDENRTFPVQITRAQIIQKSVRSKMVEPGYAWIRVTQFQESTAADFIEHVKKAIKEDPKLKGIVLDLRNNPGGLLDSSVGILSVFLPEGLTAVTTNGQLAQSKSTIKVDKESVRDPANPNKRLTNAHQGLREELKGIEVVVLVNEGSASASEIVAGAIQDHKRGRVIGAQSFGKGSVQTEYRLSGDASLKLTTSRYYTPSGKSIQASGIVPDTLVDESEEGNPFAVLRMRESDYDKHLNTTTGTEGSDKSLEKAREQARKAWEEELRKPADQRWRPPEFGTEKDFQLRQALNSLKGLPVVASKTQQLRKGETTAKAETEAAK
jgi:carboxyl-terminal processing protease